LPTETTAMETRKAPHRAANIAISLPGTVFGEISPYPTVVMVITMSQILLKRCFELFVLVYIKIGSSYTLVKYERITTEKIM